MNKDIKIVTTENGAKIFYSISNYEINRRVDIMLNELDKIIEWILHNENEAYLRVCLNRLKAYENMRKEAIEFVKKYQRKDEFLNLNEWQTRDLLNILNKVGGSDE